MNSEVDFPRTVPKADLYQGVRLLGELAHQFSYKSIFENDLGTLTSEGWWVLLRNNKAIEVRFTEKLDSRSLLETNEVGPCFFMQHHHDHLAHPD